MGKKRKIAPIPILAVAFCFALASPAQAEEKIKSLKWLDHKPNPRFAIHDPGTHTEEGDDLVLDKETELVWARNAHLAGKKLTWEDAINHFQDLTLGYCKGWRLPTKEELSSLIDPSQAGPALPKGHPFINMKFNYWSSTTHEDISGEAYYVHFCAGVVGAFPKIGLFHVWPVLGP